MTGDALAALHGRCFTTPRPWRAAEFTQLLARDSTFLLGDASAFLLGQVSGAEAEVLTLAVAPEIRREGKARQLLEAFHEAANRQGAVTTLLEVAAENRAAIALYSAAGYAEIGRRKAYYRAPDGARSDALVLTRPLP